METESISMGLLSQHENCEYLTAYASISLQELSPSHSYLGNRFLKNFFFCSHSANLLHTNTNNFEKD